MGRGSTALDNYEYDQFLAENKKTRELRERRIDRARAVKKDGSGYYFNIDRQPVKIRDMTHLRRELDQRGLAIHGEYRGKAK